MFDAMKQKFAALAIGSTLKTLATSKDTRTTITGIIAGAALAIPGLDWELLLAGDPVQIAKLVSGLLVALVGILATKRNADGRTTAVGAAAGALYAVQGTLEAVVTGLVVAVLGHLTNKPAESDTGKS